MKILNIQKLLKNNETTEWLYGNLKHKLISSITENDNVEYFWENNEHNRSLK